MSATITLARQESTEIIKHINAVDKQEQLLYHCLGCGKQMIVIKSEARKRDWHFRHSVESDCSGGRDTALHDFAVQIIMENKDISISKKLQIVYSEPRKEVTFFGKRSDVTVKYENEDIHFSGVSLKVLCMWLLGKASTPIKGNTTGTGQTGFIGLNQY